MDRLSMLLTGQPSVKPKDDFADNVMAYIESENVININMPKQKKIYTNYAKGFICLTAAAILVIMNLTPLSAVLDGRQAHPTDSLDANHAGAEFRMEIEESWDNITSVAGGVFSPDK